MTAIPNPYISDDVAATMPLPFLLDTPKFLRDLYGSHRLPPCDDDLFLEEDDEAETPLNLSALTVEELAPLVEVLTAYR